MEIRIGIDSSPDVKGGMKEMIEGKYIKLQGKSYRRK